MILTLTVNPALDLSTHISGLVPEKKLRCTTPDYFPGGGGVNVSRALSRLGVESMAMYLAGGPAGEMISQLLKEEEIRTHAIEVSSWTRENITVRDDASGNQYRFTFPGLPLAAADPERILAALAGLPSFPSYLVLSGSFAPDFPLDFLQKLNELCIRNKAKLVVDTSGPFLSAAVESGVYFLKPNYQELCELAGIQSTDLHDVQRIAREVIEKHGVQMVVVSLGPNGASLITKTEFYHVHAPRVPVKSTVGAGDSMLAGIVYALSKGESLKEVLKWGVACGTATTMNEGTGLFQAEQVERVRKLIR